VISPAPVLGVDLAWSERGGTGVCHVRGATVLESGRLGPYEEVATWLAERIDGRTLVALDAPLVVPPGPLRRPCDNLISRAFGARHASTHSAHRGLAAFADGGRAARLAADLGLDVDPGFAQGSDGRRAIEVYPHSAIVALFDLPATLKYKGKPGRTLASRTAELGRLLDLLEELRDRDPPLDVTSSPRWAELRALVAAPGSGAALARAEDEIDAYVCAYVGLAWSYGPRDSCRVAGTAAEGYIVTPTTPALARHLDELGPD
jgi:predicted RNase H-like nuclease